MKYNKYSYAFASELVKRNKSLQNRVFDLVKNGYTIGTRYITKKNGYLKPCEVEYIQSKNEYRMVVGYKPSHLSREAICVIWSE